MKLHCPDCAAQIPSRDINITQLVAKCEACNSVFIFEDQLRGEQVEIAPQRDGIERPELALPSGMSLNTDDGRLVITRRWFSCMSLPLVGFALCWDAFLVLWYTMALQAPGPISAIAVLFPLIHVAVGLGVTYYSAAMLINRTKIEADDEKITIWHGPIPWRGNRALFTQAVAQLYVSREQKTNRRTGETTESFGVHALLDDQTSVNLVNGLSSRFQALFIEQELERCLEIRPATVQGEYVPMPHELSGGVTGRESGSLSLARERPSGGVSIVESVSDAPSDDH